MTCKDLCVSTRNQIPNPCMRARTNVRGTPNAKTPKPKAQRKDQNLRPHVTSPMLPFSRGNPRDTQQIPNPMYASTKLNIQRGKPNAKTPKPKAKRKVQNFKPSVSSPMLPFSRGNPPNVTSPMSQASAATPTFESAKFEMS